MNQDLQGMNRQGPYIAANVAEQPKVAAVVAIPAGWALLEAGKAFFVGTGVLGSLWGASKLGEKLAERHNTLREAEGGEEQPRSQSGRPKVAEDERKAAVDMLKDEIGQYSDPRDVPEEIKELAEQAGVSWRQYLNRPGSPDRNFTKVKKAYKEASERAGMPRPRGRGLEWHENGKWGSPQRGDGKHGIRLDPPHNNIEGHPESKPHFNWWNGKSKGAVPIE